MRWCSGPRYWVLNTTWHPHITYLRCNPGHVFMHGYTVIDSTKLYGTSTKGYFGVLVTNMFQQWLLPHCCDISYLGVKTHEAILEKNFGWFQIFDAVDVIYVAGCIDSVIDFFWSNLNLLAGVLLGIFIPQVSSWHDFVFNIQMVLNDKDDHRAAQEGQFGKWLFLEFWVQNTHVLSVVSELSSKRLVNHFVHWIATSSLHYPQGYDFNFAAALPGRYIILRWEIIVYLGCSRALSVGLVWMFH